MKIKVLKKNEKAIDNDIFWNGWFLNSSKVRRLHKIDEPWLNKQYLQTEITKHKTEIQRSNDLNLLVFTTNPKYREDTKILPTRPKNIHPLKHVVKSWGLIRLVQTRTMVVYLGPDNGGLFGSGQWWCIWVHWNGGILQGQPFSLQKRGKRYKKNIQTLKSR